MKNYLTLKNFLRFIFLLFVWALFVAMEYAFDGEINLKTLVRAALPAITTVFIPPLIMKRYQKKIESKN